MLNKYFFLVFIFFLASCNDSGAGNQPPTITSSSSFKVDEGITLIGKVAVEDIEDDVITFSISGDEISINSLGELIFISPPDYEIKDSFDAVVTVNDGVNEVTQNIDVSINDSLCEFNTAATFDYCNFNPES